MLLLLAASLVAHRMVAQPVTFEQPAMSLKRLMPLLAEATHLPLSASPAIEGEVVCVDVREVTLADLEARLAEAVGADWVQTTQGLILMRDDAKRKAIEAQAYQQRVERLSTCIKELAPHAAVRPGKAEPAFQYEGRGEEGAQDPIFYHLLAGIGSRRLSRIGFGERVVWSTDPTNCQIGLPASTAAAVSGYIARRNKVAAADDAKAEAGAAKETDFKKDDGPPLSFYKFGPDGIKGAPHTTLLIVSRSGVASDNAELDCELVLYDSTGKVLGTDSAQLGNTLDPEARRQWMAQWAEAARGAGAPGVRPEEAAPPSGKPLDLRPETRDLAAYVEAVARQFTASNMAQVYSRAAAPAAPGPPAALQARIRARIAEPEKLDPLAYSADLVVGLGKFSGDQVVCCVPDAFAGFLGQVTQAALTTDVVDRMLSAEPHVVRRRVGGWLLVSPSSFAVDPMDRTDLKRIGLAIAATNYPTIEQLGEAALAGWDTNPGLQQMGLLCDLGQEFAFAEMDWDMLRLYASLDPGRRAELAAGERLLVSSLSPVLHGLVERMIFGARPTTGWGTSLQVERSDPKTPETPEQSELRDSPLAYRLMPTTPSDYRAEPTEVAPDGLRAEATVTMKQMTNQVLAPVLPSDAPQPSPLMALTMYETAEMQVKHFARTEAMRDLPQYAAVVAQLPKVDKVRLGTRTMLAFRIYVSPGVFLPGMLSESSFPEGSTYTMTTLPKPLQEKYDAALESAKDTMANLGGRVKP